MRQQSPGPQGLLQEAGDAKGMHLHCVALGCHIHSFEPIIQNITQTEQGIHSILKAVFARKQRANNCVKGRITSLFIPAWKTPRVSTIISIERWIPSNTSTATSSTSAVVRGTVAWPQRRACLMWDSRRRVKLCWRRSSFCSRFAAAADVGSAVIAAFTRSCVVPSM
jgi:hypothetical protein